MLIVVTSFRFRIDQVVPSWDGSQDVLLVGERLVASYNAKVGDLITVQTTSGIVSGSITGFPLISFVNSNWVGVTVSGVDVAYGLGGLIADIQPPIGRVAENKEEDKLTTDEHAGAENDAVRGTQVFMALPVRTDDGTAPFLRCLVDVVRVLGIEVDHEPDPSDPERWELEARAALRDACRQGLTLSDAAFNALIKAAVYDPDPSFNRQFVEPALNGFGRRRVRSVLLDYLRTGTNQERAGAARAWYWSALPLRLDHVRSDNPNIGGRTELDDRSILTTDWYASALREFVSNDHLDVRRCILPGLPLRTSAYPPELRDLVEKAVAIARSHPDEYIRHRVEHQVRE